MRYLRRITLLGVIAVLACAAFAPGAYARGGSGGGSGSARADIPKDPALATPEGYDERPVEAGGSGDGSNNLTFGAFDDGDLIVAIENFSVGHAGVWDSRYYSNASSSCVWSAVKSGAGQVVREAPIRYRTYDRAWGLWVPGVTATLRTKARDYCAAQLGEPYDISASKSDESRWYCSKLAWSGYKQRATVDLDANGGFWVAPTDLYNDNDTHVFVAAN